jgi:SAM-dependent methyltransferase
MSTNWQVIEGQENHEWLLERYLDLLIRLKPSSVLDVGCGSGRLLKRCIDRGLSATGIDQESPTLDGLIAEGLDVQTGSAYELPVPDRSVDWVLMRHVPHHLADPSKAFAEALRVAKVGLLVAEPCFDESLPCQRAAVALDAWEKTQHRRRGMIHDMVLSSGELLDAMPEGFAREFDVEVQLHRRLRGRSVDDFEKAAEELLGDLANPDAERRTLDRLLARLRQDGLSWNGSMCVALTRRS